MSREIENTKKPRFNKSKTYLLPLLSEVLDLNIKFLPYLINTYLFDENNEYEDCIFILHEFNFKNPEQLGGNATNSLNVGSSDNYNWTFTNTLEYSNLIAKDHNVGILLGTEAIEELATSFSASRKDFFAETKPYRYLIASSGSQTNGAGTPVELRLSSVFGKLDYAYKDKYFFSKYQIKLDISFENF